MTNHSTPADLPADLLAFLRDGRQFEYDPEGTSIGRITLKNEKDLARTTIRTFPGCQSIIDDPYSSLDGLYHADVYDLVAESEDYRTEGLLCWIPAVQRFGCIDPEHGDVITYPEATWTDIVADPLPYLEAQWFDHEEVAERVLPWIHFPFELGESNGTIAPYGPNCAIHNAPVVQHATPKPPLFELLQQREMEDWFLRSRTHFPYGGVPLTENELLCCSQCRSAEDAWLQNAFDSIPPVDVKPNAHGWLQCPSCEIRFSMTDPGAYSNGVCLTCGQRINVAT